MATMQESGVLSNARDAVVARHLSRNHVDILIQGHTQHMTLSARNLHHGRRGFNSNPGRLSNHLYFRISAICSALNVACFEAVNAENPSDESTAAGTGDTGASASPASTTSADASSTTSATSSQESYGTSDANVPPTCGDGILDPGEECDDANTIEEDGCLSTCRGNRCGDGHIWAAREYCDDGNDRNTDRCVTGCRWAYCGDGYIEIGEEICDDGNELDGDDCPADCGASGISDTTADPTTNSEDDNTGPDDTTSLESTDGGTDDDPPTVVSVWPNDANVEPTTSIAITFSEPIASSTITSESFVVRGPHGPVEGSWDYEGIQLTWTPELPLTLTTTFTVHATQSITDESGLPLDAPEQSGSFTVRDGVWHEAELIEVNNSGNAALSRIGIDNEGNAVAIWVQRHNEQAVFDLWANRFTQEAGWLGASRIEDQATSLGQTSAATNIEGHAIATWDPIGTPYEIWVTRFSDSAWTPPQRIATTSATISDHKASVGANGEAFVVWIDNSLEEVFSRRYNPQTSAWEAEASIATPGSFISLLSLGTGKSGHSLVAWLASGAPDNAYALYASHTAPEGDWSVAEPIHADDTQPTVPLIAVNRSGAALLSWSHQTDGAAFIWSNWLTASGTWTGPEVIATHDETNQTPLETAAALNDAGQGVVVWLQYNGSNPEIWARVAGSVDEWGATMRIDTANVAAPEVEIDSSGNVVVVYHKWPSNDVWASRYTARTGTWSSPAPLGTDLSASSAMVALRPDGTGLVAWQQSDGTLTNIWAREFR